MIQQKHSLDFGKKEKILNYACQTYQLPRPNKVGAVFSQSVRIASLGRICHVPNNLHSVGMHPIINRKME
jgi:hypothetical protein